MNFLILFTILFLSAFIMAAPIDDPTALPLPGCGTVLSFTSDTQTLSDNGACRPLEVKADRFNVLKSCRCAFFIGETCDTTEPGNVQWIGQGPRMGNVSKAKRYLCERKPQEQNGGCTAV